MLKSLCMVTKKQLSTVEKREAPGKTPADCGDVRLRVEL